MEITIITLECTYLSHRTLSKKKTVCRLPSHPRRHSCDKYVPFSHSFDFDTQKCAPSGSIPNINNIIDVPPTVSSEPRQSFVDKIHGLTDKLQSLSHLGSHDSSSADSKGKAGKHIMYMLCMFIICIYIIQGYQE